MASTLPVATIIGSRIVVLSKDQGAKLYKDGFFGKPVNVHKPKDTEVNAPLELSPFEASYLLEKGRISVESGGRPVSIDEMVQFSRAIFRIFDELYAVYKDLREKGYVVRPGMKFGSDFAVYEYGPGIDHAPFVIHVLPSSAEVDPIEIVRAGRLSHTVRKKFILATLDRSRSKVLYFMFMWWKA
ncbi:MAG: tRNA-intron lyase [Candidatus Methanosuratus sp.]|nr:tRNA-intron lyase [Candidatus Methanosuratincola sp.]